MGPVRSGPVRVHFHLTSNAPFPQKNFNVSLKTIPSLISFFLSFICLSFNNNYSLEFCISRDFSLCHCKLFIVSATEEFFIFAFFKMKQQQFELEEEEEEEEEEFYDDENPSKTFDEVSMETSKSFVKALHELKNLRPQLYSAAEYCEKSYLNSEQKQMVLDNLKDYAVRALVNAVDHLGTVAYKLTDLFEQQTEDISTMELKVSCLNQELLTCQTYMDKEGLRQQQLLTSVPRHHKHYILPNSVNKKVHFSPQNIQMEARQKLIHQAKPCVYPSGIPASQTLSWHLSSETSFNGNQQLPTSEDTKALRATATAFQLLESVDAVSVSSSSAHQNQSLVGDPTSNVALPSFGVTRRDSSRHASKQVGAHRSFDNAGRKIIRAPIRSRSLLSAFLAKQRTKAGCISG
ncbi:protein ABIL1-like isoform X2 [Papaver somniferum]|uniref:protein ABIL1-like isoform X2 n=1 Tax=Papaver somniferum TaxID=3469 RepID=UPI000E701F61|nr:protein ABIL1-like isoform X2 [Papaver somniferum]